MIRPQSELTRTHVVSVSCLSLQDDAYHWFLNHFFSSVTLTPCLSNSGLGRIAPADHAGASPFANNEKKAQKLCFFDTILVSVRGCAYFFWGRFFLCVCVHLYAYENMHWSQIGAFRSAEFPKISPPITIRLQFELARTHVVTMSCLHLQDDAYHRFLNRFFSSVILTPCLINLGLRRIAHADHAGASPLANNE